MRPRRRVALTVLLAAAVIAVASFPFRATWWGGWILAVAEAGIVGGLADWFAVTAIFRRPLGLPVPHTALIVTNWEAMARRLGTMVGDRVLTRAYVLREVERLDLAALLARAAVRVTAEEIASATRAVARWLVRQIADVSGAEGVGRLVGLVRGWPPAPALARAIEVAREQGWDRRAVTSAADALATALDRPLFRAAVVDGLDDLLWRYRTACTLYPRLLLTVADLVGALDRERMVAALQAGLREVARDAEHPLRRQIDDALRGLPKRLREDAALAARLEALKAELLDAEALTNAAREALASLERALRRDVGRPESHVVGWVAERLEAARHRLVEDATLRADIERWVKSRAIELVERHHGRMAAFIENGVRALGPEGAVRLIEEHAGDDLQYIRVNGTLVGGLAGGGIYGVHLFVRWLG